VAGSRAAGAGATGDRDLASTEEVSRVEQRTLKLSIYGVVLMTVGSVAYGLYLESDIVILNGIFSVLSLVAGGLRFLAAKLIAKPEDERFPYGYSHVEPLVHTINGFLVLVICVYSFINGIEGIRHGGHEVDAAGVIWFSIVSGAFCLGFGVYELALSRKIGSELLRNDAKEWLMDLAFSIVTLLGFAVLPFLPEPYRGIWARYADSAMVTVLAVLLIPVPFGILKDSLGEVLLMAAPNDALVRRVEAVIQQVKSEYDIVREVHYVVKSGRVYFIELDVVVGPRFELQTIAQQDQLRSRIWTAIDMPLDKAWLSICMTIDPRWV
jgi:cation diffusion facilitator family transporter